jgi:hypothetical protein
MTRPIRFAALLALVALLAAPLAAQERSDRNLPRVSLSGVVYDSAGNPVADVALQLRPSDKTVTSNSNGYFTFDDLGPEHLTYQVRARRLGFMPTTAFIRMMGRDTTVAIRLQKRPQLLDTVVVTGRECARNYFDGFLCRRAADKGGAIYLTEADILAKNPKFLADVVSGIKGFRIEPTVGPYGPNRTVAVAQSRCVVQLVNGRPPVMTGGIQDSSGGFVPMTLEEALTPENLIGVEIYPPGTYAPIEYANLAERYPQAAGPSSVRGSGMRRRTRRAPPPPIRCSLINYWTASGIRRNPVRPAAAIDSAAKRDTTKPPVR